MAHQRKHAPSAPVSAHARRDAGDAFLRDPEGGESRAPDDLAEMIAEAYLESATSGEERGEELLNDFVTEELGGPFLEDSMLGEPDDLPPLRAKPPGDRHV